MKTQARKIAAAAAVLCGLAAGPAFANLVLVSPQPIGGTGLGAVSTVLTLQSPANSSVESGSVARAGGVDVLSGNTTALNSTYSFGELSITNASQIGIVFNASEPAPANDVTLTGLQLSIYSATGGAALFSSGNVVCGATVNNCNLTNTFSGTGNSGFLFTLDTTQAAAANSFITGTNRIGLSATATSATGGNETFFVTRLAGTVTPPIPEPETYALMLAGLGLMAFMARRRMR